MEYSLDIDIQKSTRFYMKYRWGEYHIENSQGLVIAYGYTSQECMDRFDNYLMNIDLDGEYSIVKGAGVIYGTRRSKAYA